MGYSIPIQNGIISMCYTDFKCPVCECVHGEDDYFKRMQKSKYGLIYRKCKGCKTMLGITTCMRGDVKVWIKSEEK